MTTKAVGYVRVSTSGQASDDKTSLNNQKNQIAEYCQYEKLELLRYYEDPGWSGVKDDRPGLHESKTRRKD